MDPSTTSLQEQTQASMPVKKGTDYQGNHIISRRILLTTNKRKYFIFTFAETFSLFHISLIGIYE